MEQYYNIEEQATNGWEILNEKLTKEQCTQKLKEYIDQGYNPNHLRVRRHVD